MAGTGPKAPATPAVAFLARSGVAYRVHRYDHDPTARSYGQEAADALGVEAARVYKTLVVAVDVGLVVAVVPVTGELDLKALAAAVGGKRATMADPATAERATGYVVGGISPIGGQRRLPTVVDDGALGSDTIFISGGRRGLELELAPADLVRLTAARLARLAR